MPASSVLTLQEVFRGFLLRIPEYQRGYAWEAKQVQDLLDDLDLLSPGTAHYFGTLILDTTVNGGSTMEDSAGTTYRVAHVVDGQQRLTTSVILLAALARKLRRLGEVDLADGLRFTYVSGRTRDNQPLPKLRLNHSPDFWEDNILADTPGTVPAAYVSDRRLRDARRQIELYLASMEQRAGADYASWLNELREKLVTHLKLTVYEVDESLEVGIIFETQNNRGVVLTDLDKMKNLLLYLSSKFSGAPDDLSARINETWGVVLQALNRRNLVRRDDEDALLRCVWVLGYDSNPREWHGFDSLKAHFSLRRFRGREAELANEIRAYLSLLSNAVGPYCDALRPTHSDAFRDWDREPDERAAVIESSDRLRRVGAIANSIPLLVALRLRGDLSAAAYRSAVDAAEVMSFRFRAVGTRSNAGQSNLYWLAGRVLRGQADVQAVLTTLRQHAATYGSAVLLRLRLSAMGNWYAWPLLRYVLYEYEEKRAADHQNRPKVRWRALANRDLDETVEHILPQKADDPYWVARIDTEAFSRVINDLGNLCLTNNNSSYHNKSFPKKKGVYGQTAPCYANSVLYQERDLASYPDWTEATIAERRERLLEFIWERWQVEPIPVEQLQKAGVSAEAVGQVPDEEAEGEEEVEIETIDPPETLGVEEVVPVVEEGKSETREGESGV